MSLISVQGLQRKSRKNLSQSEASEAVYDYGWARKPKPGRGYLVVAFHQVSSYICTCACQVTGLRWETLKILILTSSVPPLFISAREPPNLQTFVESPALIMSKTNKSPKRSIIAHLSKTRHYCDWNHHRGPAIAILHLGHWSVKNRSRTQTIKWYQYISRQDEQLV